MSAKTEQAFASFVSASLPTLLRFGHVLTGDPRQAEDLVQAALLRTWGAWARIERRDQPIVYVRRIMVNAHISWWRRFGRREVAVATHDDRPDLAPQLAYEERADMWRALGQLGPRQRAVLVLRYYEQLSEAEIANVLDCSVGTVKSQAARGLDRLRTVLTTSDEMPLVEGERRA
jgi:RNA polymerase sigma-70 factor (sigma-E family)